MKKIGLLGGTFDPVHKGHIQIARAACELLYLDEVRLIPCHQPPHRELPQLSSEQRITLLDLAVSEWDELIVDGRELLRDCPSYTVDTLNSLRRDLGDEISLVLLMGMDAYESLTAWYEWEKILEMSHIGVLQRPGYSLAEKDCSEQRILSSLLNDSTKEQIDLKPAGAVVLLNQPQINISATQMREQLSKGVVPKGLVPSVEHYITSNRLYGFDA